MAAQAATPGRRWLRLPTPWALALLCVLFLAGHLPFLIVAPGDMDELNFALAVNRFDVAAHQPHPPGYPVFVVLGKIVTPMLRWWSEAPREASGPVATEARALSLWAAVFGALGLGAWLVVFRAFENRTDTALAATALTAAAPLYWFSAARPLSDVPGLTAVALANALLLWVWRAARGATPDEFAAGAPRLLRRLMGGALVAGFAVGLRSQALWLILPIWLVVLADWPGDRIRLALAGVLAWAFGVVIWAFPMVVASGGLPEYLNALRWQASEDLTSVEMLWTHPTARHVLRWTAVRFLHPWGFAPLAVVVLAAAAVGAVALARRGSRTGLIVAAAIVPYLVFDLLFQEAVTVRYSLPIVPVVAYLAVRGLTALARRAWPSVAAVVAASLLVGTTALADHANVLPPVLQALADMRARERAEPAERHVLAMHEPYQPIMRGQEAIGRPLSLTPMYEWLDLGRYWLDGERDPIWFLADPRRATLAQIDPLSRHLVREYMFAHRWPFTQRLMGGVRPSRVQWWQLDPPGWILGEGWAVTPEAGGVARPGRRGPYEAPIIGYVRRRPDAAVMMIGGRHLTPDDRRAVTMTAFLEGRPVASWSIVPGAGAYLEWIDLDVGALSGPAGYAKLSVSAATADVPQPAVSVEQFDLQSAGSLMYAFGPGWHELEYDNTTGWQWRWTADRATIITRGAPRDVTLTMTGQSPLLDFDGPPVVTVRAGETVLASLTPSANFSWSFRVPAAALGRADGIITLETDRTFVPAERGQSLDRRRLGLRIFELTLR